MNTDIEKPEIIVQRIGKDLTRPLLTITIFTSFGSSLQFGYNLWVVNHPATLIQNFYNSTYWFRKKKHIETKFLSFLYSLTVATYSLGGLVGSLMVCLMVDRCGRKGTLVLTNFLSIISSLLMVFSTMIQAYEYAIFSRLISGMCSGIFSSVVPMYLAEIAPRNHRGAIVTFSMLAIAFGVLISQILGMQELLGSMRDWPILLSFPGFLGVFQLFVLPGFPESPRYLLIQRKNEEKARKVLRSLRAKEDVENEIEELHLEDVSEQTEREMNKLKRLAYEGLRWQMVSVVILIGGQQLAGVNAVHYYIEKIYQTVWLKKDESRYIGILSSVFTIILLFVVISTIDTVGRRILILVGFGLCSILSVLLTLTLELQKTVSWMTYVTSSFLFLYLMGYILGPGPVPSVIVTELFLQSSRSIGFALGGFLFWSLHLLSGVVFLQVETRIGSYSLLLFWPLCVASFVLIFKLIPETKNRSFLDIKRLMAAHITTKIEVQESQGKKLALSVGKRRKKQKGPMSTP